MDDGDITLPSAAANDVLRRLAEVEKRSIATADLAADTQGKLLRLERRILDCEVALGLAVRPAKTTAEVATLKRVEGVIKRSSQKLERIIKKEE